MDTTPRDRFLRVVRRAPALVANTFLNTIRSGGASTPAGVLAGVMAEALRRIRSRWSSEEDRRFWRSVGRACRDEHRAEALACAQYYLDYAALPPEARERLKQAQGEKARRAWMDKQEPTDAQLRYLQFLGYEGPVRSKQHASELIDQRVEPKGAGERQGAGR